MSSNFRYVVRLFACFLAIFSISHAAPERIAILGDSITSDGRWPTWVESALLETPAYRDAEIVNFGLGSETVSGLSEPNHAGGKFPRPCLHERLERILDGFKPTLVLACYGMNDGIYLPLEPARFQAYKDGIGKLKAAVESRHARIVFITPPLHNADKPSDKPSDDPNRYDAALDAYGEWLVSRRAEGWQVIDIRPDLKKAVAEGKVKNPAFTYAKDNIHPGDDGHRFMAESVTRQLWPILKLRGAPGFPADGPFAILRKRNEILKLAWLTKTRHIRPGIPAGLPLESAEAEAAKRLEEYRDMNTRKTSDWNGYERLDFNFEGRNALIVRPKSAAAEKPWIWRTEFFGHEPQGDLALLAKGFHVAYLDMRDLYGAPVALDAMDHFHAHLVRTFGLSKKAVLEGFSRGGLYAFNWAARRPEEVAGLYVDAPVCDFKSWPGGKGVGPGSPQDWAKLLEVYGFANEAQALAWPGNPVDNLAPLAKSKIPVFAIIGAADEAVPVAENIDLIENRYKALGGKIEVIRKPGGKHHPHSLKDPAPIVAFAVSCYP